MKLKKGDVVVYGSYGKCEILGIEEMKISGKSQKFFRLRKYRPGSTRLQGTNTDVTFMVPHDNKDKLRKPVGEVEVNQALEALKTDEKTINPKNLDDNWITHQRKFDEYIRKDGILGMAKTVSLLNGYCKTAVIPSTTVKKYYENVKKLFAQEISGALDINTKECEGRLEKLMH